MPWFKVDDALATHDKVLSAGNPAMGLWVRAGAWSAQNLTDGHVPMRAVRLLGNMAQARSLVACGLWTEADDGFLFHEWHDYQPTREQVEAERAEARERMQRLRSRRGKGSPEVRPNKDRSSPEVRSPGSSQPGSSQPRPVPSRPLTVVTYPVSPESVARELDDDGLTRIRQALNGCPEAHARKTAAFVLAKAPADVRNPTAYVLAAIADEPEAYRYRRGNPKRDQECPTHAGQWADHCAGCAADRKAGNA